MVKPARVIGVCSISLVSRFALRLLRAAGRVGEWRAIPAGRKGRATANGTFAAPHAWCAYCTGIMTIDRRELAPAIGHGKRRARDGMMYHAFEAYQQLLAPWRYL